MELSFLQLIETEANLVGAVGIEIASLISKSHRTKALPTALAKCCQRDMHASSLKCDAIFTARSFDLGIFIQFDILRP